MNATSRSAPPESVNRASTVPLLSLVTVASLASRFTAANAACTAAAGGGCGRPGDGMEAGGTAGAPGPPAGAFSTPGAGALAGGDERGPKKMSANAAISSTAPMVKFFL